MIPEWKTIKEFGLPANNVTVMFVDKYGDKHIGFFRTATRGKYKGVTFIESRVKNESNGMYGSYVHKSSTFHDSESHHALDSIVKWDYLPE